MALTAQPAEATTEGFTARWDKRTDTSTSLIQMGVRAYDPGLGRFIQVDPVEGGSANLYDYAAQDPVSNYDLDGRICWRCKLRRWGRRLAVASVAIGAVGLVLATGGASVAVYAGYAFAASATMARTSAVMQAAGGDYLGAAGAAFGARGAANLRRGLPWPSKAFGKSMWQTGKFFGRWTLSMWKIRRRGW